MCDDLLSLMTEDEEFLKQIIFSDEATFNINIDLSIAITAGYGDHLHQRKQCNRYKEAPKSLHVAYWHQFRQDLQTFFEENVKSANYLDMLQQCFVPTLSRRARNTCIFQQDGALAHYGKMVREYLDSTFPRRLIGRTGQMAWAPRSPDLYPLDFFMWGLLKDRVYHRKPHSSSSLKAFIEEEYSNVDQQSVKNAILSFQTRLKICVDNEGTSVEHY